MSKIDKDTLITSDVPAASVSVSLPRRAVRMATPLDLLFMLAAFLAYSFGWGPVLGLPTVPTVVAAALLWLGIEVVAQWLGLRVSVGSWISLTKIDVVILLAALFVSTLKDNLLFVVVPIWLIVAVLALLHVWRISADGWFHWAALLTSLMAIEVGAEAAEVWLHAGDNGGPPSPLTHIGFHEFLDGGIEVSCVFLLLLLAWWALRQRQAWGVAALVGSAFPAALASGWASAGAVLNQRPYGYEHSYAWLLAAFWLLGALSAIWGLVLERRAASVKVFSSEEIFVTAAIGIVAPFGIALVGEIDVVLVLAIIGWLVMVTIAWLRGTRVGADGWYHRTIILTSLIAVEVSAEISKIWLCGGGYGGTPTPLDHIGFHHLLDGGIGWSCILLVLLLVWLPATVWTPSFQAPLTWRPLRQSQFWRLSALLAATLPAALIGGWAAYVALSHQRDYGYLHPFAWLLALFWYLSFISAMRCFTLQRRG